MPTVASMSAITPKPNIAELRGTVQNDTLKEYVARGNSGYPPEGALRVANDPTGVSAVAAVRAQLADGEQGEGGPRARTVGA